MSAWSSRSPATKNATATATYVTTRIAPRPFDAWPPQRAIDVTRRPTVRASDLDDPEAEGERVDEEGDQADRGDEEHRDLRRRGERDLGRERDLPAGGDDDGAAVLGGVADDRDDHGRDEELGDADLLGEDLERADEDLGDERGDDRRDAEDEQRQLEAPARDLLVARDVHLPWRRSEITVATR